MIANNKVQAGFTLVEMLVALVLLSMISLAGYQGVVYGMTQWRNGEQKLSAVVDELQARNWIRQRLGSAERISYASGGKYPLAFDGSENRVRFISRFGMARQGGLYVCELALDHKTEALNVRYGLYHPENGSFNKPASVSQVAILDKVKLLRFSYYGGLDGKEPRWHSQWQNSQVLPVAVSIDVTKASGRSELQVIYIETADRI